MRKRFTAWLLVALMTASMVFPAATAAAPTEVQRLQDQIKQLKDEVQKAGEAYSAAYWQLDKTRAGGGGGGGGVGQRLSARAAAMYRTGSYDYMAILLSASDFDEMLTRLQYVQRINDSDASLIAEAKTAREELAAQKAQLEALEKSQAEEAAALKKEAQRIERELKAQQAEYTKLQKKLEAAIAAEKARTGTTTAKAGPNGMVFPVRGPNYYNDTWGAARSGGRTHKGTDIMAATGTPCVAVLSGTVRSKENSLGGKTIWLTADNGWAFYYAHLNSYEVTSGRVQAGQVIGYVGSTGNASASAPHLHFEIHPGGGAAVNPYPFLQKMQ